MAMQLGCAVLAGLVLGLGSGCRSWRSKKPGLLAPRAIVPPPYTSPAAPGTTPALPSYNPTPEALPPVQPAELPPEPMLPPVETDVTPPSPPEEIEPAVELPPAVESQPLTYTVKKGDSLWSIAHMYGVTFQELAAENNLDPKAVLPVGKVLRIPPGGRFVPPAERPKVKPAKTSSKTSSGRTTPKPATSSSITKQSIPANGTYKVQSGDSLWKIARKFGLKTDDIRRINNLKTDTLQIGQELKLVEGGAARNTSITPAPKPKPAAPTVERGGPPPVIIDTDVPKAPAATADDNANAAEDDGRDDGDEPKNTIKPAPVPVLPEPALAFPKKLSHTVSKDETLKTIAEMYGTTVEDILKENPAIKGDADLEVNMKIMVPYR
jgi:LysM repeat protein